MKKMRNNTVDVEAAKGEAVVVAEEDIEVVVTEVADVAVVEEEEEVEDVVVEMAVVDVEVAAVVVVKAVVGEGKVDGVVDQVITVVLGEGTLIKLFPHADLCAVSMKLVFVLI